MTSTAAPARNFNRTLALARGAYFKWAAADDVCGRSFVRRCLERFDEANGPTALCYPKTTVIDDDGEPVAEFEDEFEILEDRPSDRLSHFLSVRTEYHPVFGLIRTDLLRRTRGIGSFVASDVVVLAELALQGRFLEVPERLFLRRFHDATSVRANPDPDARAEWFDPARRGGAVLPWSRLTFELGRSVARADLPLAERARCEAVLTRRWALPYTRVIGGEVKAAARTQARSVLPRVRP